MGSVNVKRSEWRSWNLDKGKGSRKGGRRGQASIPGPGP